MKKTLFCCLLVVALTFVCVGCNRDSEKASTDKNSSADGGENSSVKKDGLSFVYFVSHMENEFQSQLVAAVEASAKDKGINLTVVSADKDPAKQVSQIDNAIAAGNIDGALIQATSAEGVTAGVKALKDAGIPAITLHEAIAAQDLVTSYVGPDLPTIGLIVMQHVCEELDGNGKIAILNGVQGNSVAVSISGSYKEILEKYPDIDVVFEDSADWVTDKALAKLENWLSTGKEFETVVCMNDGMAIGAMQAVNSAGKTGEIKIYGSDATEQAVSAVKNGEMTGTVYFDIEDEGQAAVETLLKAAQGETVETEVLMPPTLLTSENIKEYFPD